MIGHTTVDARLHSVDVSGRLPKDALQRQKVVFFVGDVIAQRQVVTTTEMPVTLPGYDDRSDGAILPSVTPSVGELERASFVDDVGSTSVVKGDDRDVTVGLVADAHFCGSGAGDFRLENNLTKNMCENSRNFAIDALQ